MKLDKTMYFQNSKTKLFYNLDKKNLYKKIRTWEIYFNDTHARTLAPGGLPKN